MKVQTPQKELKITAGKFQEAGIFFVVIAICLIIGFINSSFYSIDNLLNLLRQTSYVVIVAIFTTMVMILGGLDMSIGSVIGLSGIAAAMFIKAGIPIPIAILMALCVSSVIGIMNGVLIVIVRIPSLIVTLGTLYIARGICNGLTKGEPVYPLPDEFASIGNGTLFGIPYSVYFVIIIALIINFILKNTTFGRSIYAIGGNEETARLSGIKVRKIKIIVYILNSIAAAIAGVIMTSRIASGQTSMGTGWELTAISSAVIGGTSMLGGSGTVLGSILGATLMAVIANGMIIMNVSVYWQSIVIGSIIILAVAIDIIRKRKAGMDVK